MDTPELRYLNQLIEEQPTNITAYLRRGAVVAEFDLSLALADFDKAVELDPKCAEAYGNRGLVHYRMKNLELALQDYQTALDIDPGLVEIHFNRGLIRAKQQDFKKAIVDFDNAISLEPDYHSAHNERTRCLLNISSYVAAIESANKAMKIRPAYASDYYYRAIAYDGLAETSKAKQDLEKALALGISGNQKRDAENLLNKLKDR